MIDYTLPLDELPDPLPIVPLEKPFDVTITPPGSKSITNRAYVLAALAEGESRIIRPLRSEDCDLLLKALCTLGAEARWEGDDVFIKGVAGRFPRGGSVNLGDGGTPTRFMIACACLAAEPVTVDGSQRMRERPIAEGVAMLRELGATIEYVEEEGRLPVRVTPSEDFKGGSLLVSTTKTSQFLSALLLIGALLPKGIELVFNQKVTSASYLDMTHGVLVYWDVLDDADVDWSIWDEDGEFRHDQDIQRLRVSPSTIRATELIVEPDASSALYWMIAAAVCRWSSMTIPDIAWGSNQPDCGLFELLGDYGPTVRFDDEDDAHISTSVRGTGRLMALKYDFEGQPDGAMAFVTLASLGDGESHLCGLHTLRVKETDRIAALANELRKVGCTVETTDDSITITPPIPGAHGQDARATEPVIIETYNDHRMAMSFAILGLVRPGLSIRNPRCVAKSYPTFWKDFAKLYAGGKP